MNCGFCFWLGRAVKTTGATSGVRRLLLLAAVEVVALILVINYGLEAVADRERCREIKQLFLGNISIVGLTRVRPEWR